ncbi:MAG: hypothetical protein ABEJ36_01130 [Candidatus Nanosalina sp.]
MVEVSAEAKEDLKGFRRNIREVLLDRIEEEFEKDGRENISYIHKPDFGIEFHRLKLKDGELDHRVYFDYHDSKPVVFAVRHRDDSYSEEDYEQIVDRLEEL